MLSYPITLDKPRNFKYGMRALSLIEGKFGKPFGKINQEELTIKELAVFIWAGLYHEDKDLTPDAVIDLIDDYSDMATVLNEMHKAQERGFLGEEDNGSADTVKNE